MSLTQSKVHSQINIHVDSCPKKDNSLSKKRKSYSIQSIVISSSKGNLYNILQKGISLKKNEIQYH